MADGTPCQRYPETCEPREVAHLLWDADGVLWNIKPGAIASSVCGPFTKIDEDTVEGVFCSSPGAARRGRAGEEPRREEWWYGGSSPAPGGKQGLSPEERRYVMDHLKLSEKSLEFYTGVPADLLLAMAFDVEQREITLEEAHRRLLREQEKLPPAKRAPPEQPPPPVPPPAKPPPKEKKARPEDRVRVRLLPGFRETLHELKGKGITHSVASLNDPGSVADILKALGLFDDFLEVKDSWQSKETTAREVAHRFHINPCRIIFVDDTLTNLEAVARTGALVLGMGTDIKAIPEVKKFIRGP